jgi:ribosomal protein S11
MGKLINLHITFKRNNIFLNLSDESFRCLRVESMGKHGFVNTAKTNSPTNPFLFCQKAVNSWALEYQGFSFAVKFTGYRSDGLLEFIVTLLMQKFSVVTLSDATTIPFNGCRLPKQKNRR